MERLLHRQDRKHPERSPAGAELKDAAQFSDMPYYVYILKCLDSSYYTGSTTDLEKRFAEHQEGLIEDSYTHSRRPVELVWSAQFPTHDDAFRAEQQIKGWSRAKKEALIRGDWDQMRKVIRRQKEKRKGSLKKQGKAT